MAPMPFILPYPLSSLGYDVSQKRSSIVTIETGGCDVTGLLCSQMRSVSMLQRHDRVSTGTSFRLRTRCARILSGDEHAFFLGGSQGLIARKPAVTDGTS